MLCLHTSHVFIVTAGKSSLLLLSAGMAGLLFEMYSVLYSQSVNSIPLLHYIYHRNSPLSFCTVVVPSAYIVYLTEWSDYSIFLISFSGWSETEILYH